MEAEQPVMAWNQSQPNREGTAEFPLVSILTTSFNHLRWLPDTLRSVRVQDYPSIEHVVVDDGSTDGSAGYLDQLSGRPEGSRVHSFAQANRGQARALNRAFAESHGEVVGWLNSDDVYFGPHVVSTVVRSLLDHPEAVGVYGHSVVIGPDGSILRTIWSPPANVVGWRVLRFMCSQPAVFFNRRALADWIVDERFDIAMDLELIFRLHRQGPFVRVPHIIAGERHHAMRKSYDAARCKSAAEREGPLLHDVGVREAGRAARLQITASKLAGRYFGLTLLREASSAPLAFEGRRDGWRRLLWRQLLIPRGRMVSATRTPGWARSPGSD